MRIAGLQKCSMVDYPGKVAAVVFTPGCNMSCHYCHNRSLLGRDVDESCSREEALAFLARRSRLLDGLVVTGGEPTLQPGLAGFLREVRELGLAIKLDTNGTRPDVVRELIRQELVDFVAMDLKAPLSRYGEICGVDVEPEALQETIELLLESDVEHEFRTTFTPLLNGTDVLAMAGLVRGASRLLLQQYRRLAGDPLAEQGRAITSHAAEYVRNVAEQVRSIAAVPCTTRGL